MRRKGSKIVGLWTLLVFILLGSLQYGCVHLKEPEKETLVTPAPASKGSLWSDDNGRAFLFQDNKAGRVGDIVTVRIDENASGSKDATTKTARDSSISTGLSSFFGLPTDNRDIGATASNSFDGSGSTTRSGQLTADITARVVELMPNGNMMIKGTRELLINNERQFITVSGIIRPEDITRDNTIFSASIADAKIEYSGRGVIFDNQSPGWLMRIFSWIWPL
ncbi:MAG: flagellar basal body L-ring protein FlgH [Nitrospirota bacterium]